ncbi:MAG: lipopolysaccharide biosynthesis protein, partial [Candidatus Rokuibacteriota bacterium]
MSTRDTLLRNTLWYALVTGVGLVAGLLMSVILARGLGPARMGEYSYLLWLVRTMAAVATLGYALATTRYTADALGRGDRAQAGAFVTLFARRQLMTTLVVVIAFLPFVLTLAPPDLLWPLLVVTVALFPMTLEGIYSQAAFGAQRYDITTQTSTLKMSLHLIAAIAAMAAGADILGLVIGTTLGTTITCALQRRRALALYPDRSASIDATAREELRAYLIPLSLVAVLDVVLWDRSEIFFLRLYASSAEIAFYSVAFGLGTRTMLAAEVAVGALLPTLASLHGSGNHKEFGRIYRAAIRWVALVGVPLAAVGTAVAPALITLLYGEPYRAVAVLFGPLMATALLGVMRHVAWNALWASGDRKWALNSTWASVIVKVGTALLLIPTLGAWGAVVSHAAAQLTASALAFGAVARRERCGFPVVDVVRIAAAGVAAFVCTGLL